MLQAKSSTQATEEELLSDPTEEGYTECEQNLDIAGQSTSSDPPVM